MVYLWSIYGVSMVYVWKIAVRYLWCFIDVAMEMLCGVEGVTKLCIHGLCFFDEI